MPCFTSTLLLCSIGAAARMTVIPAAAAAERLQCDSCWCLVLLLAQWPARQLLERAIKVSRPLFCLLLLPPLLLLLVTCWHACCCCCSSCLAVRPEQHHKYCISTMRARFLEARWKATALVSHDQSHCGRRCWQVICCLRDGLCIGRLIHTAYTACGLIVNTARQVK
jgi:hypothetical protein